jgi:hypothetical protein
MAPAWHMIRWVPRVRRVQTEMHARAHTEAKGARQGQESKGLCFLRGHFVVLLLRWAEQKATVSAVHMLCGQEGNKCPVVSNCLPKMQL